MADNHINFKLGSSFDGQGFNAAQKAIAANRKELNSARAGLGDLTKAFEDVHPAIGQASGMIKNFTQAFVSGGIIGGVIQLAIQGIAKAVEALNDWFDKTKERVKAFGDKADEVLLNFAKSANDRFSDLKKTINEVEDSANALTKALNQATDSSTNEKIYKIAIDKLQKITDDMTEKQKAVVEAQAALETSMVRLKGEHDKMRNKLADAISSREHAEEELQSAMLANTQAQKALSIAERNATADADEYAKILQESEAASKNLKEAQKALRDATLGEKSAREDVNQSLRKLHLAQLEGERKVRDAEAKRQQEIEEIAQKEREAAEKKAEAEAKAAEKIEKNQEEWDNFMIQQREKLENALGAPKSVGDILDEFDRILKDGAEEILGDDESSGESEGESKDKKGGKGKSGRGGAGGAGGAGGNVNIPDPLNVNVQNPGAFGNAGNQAIAPFKEVQRQQRDLARAQRDLVSELKGRFGAEMPRVISILNKDESNRSEFERQLVDYYLKDAIPTMSKVLGTEMTARFIQDQASHVLMKKDLDEFINNDKAMQKTLERVRDNTADIKNMSTQLQEATRAIRDVIVL